MGAGGDANADAQAANAAAAIPNPAGERSAMGPSADGMRSQDDQDSVADLGTKAESVAIPMAESHDREPASGASSASAAGPQKHSTVKVAAAVTFFSVSSLGSIFINKALLSAYHFGYPTTLMTLQVVAGMILMVFMRGLNFVHIPSLRAKQFPLVLWPTITWISNVLIGLYALKMVNIPMFSTLRRLSMLFVMITEWYAGKTFSRNIVISVGIVVAGSVFSAIGDLSFTRIGYALVFANNLMTALYLQSLKRALTSLKLDALQLYYYTSLLGVPIISVFALLTDFEPAVQAYYESPELRSTNFLIMLSFSAISSFMVNYATNMTTQFTSPLSTAVSSQTKNFLQTALGMLSWGYHFTFLNVLGLFTALLGSCMYSVVRFHENRAEEASRKVALERAKDEGRTSRTPVHKSSAPAEDSFAEFQRTLHSTTTGFFKNTK